MAEQSFFIDLLCFVDILRHGQEDAINQDGEHNDVIKVLVGAEKDIQASKLVPRRENEQASCGGEPLDVVFLEAPRDDTKSLQRRIHFSFNNVCIPAAKQANLSSGRNDLTRKILVINSRASD